MRLAVVALVLLAGSFAASGTSAAPGCAPARAAAQLTVTGHCYVGTAGPDRISGSALGDLIYGWAGADTIFGRGGDDHIQSGSDNDTVYGGEGTDLLEPALGNDRVYGGAGNDTIRAGGGERDWIWCGGGFDVARVDKLDVVAKDCEKVVVSRGYS
jgi:hypothetical protein